MVPYFLIVRFPVSFSRYKYNSTQIHRAFRFFYNSFTSHTSNHVQGDTFTISYLINSCGLSPHLATKISNGVLLLKTLDGPNAVLDLLKNYGFSKPQVAKLVEKKPLLLLSKANITLLPKLNFFHSIGVSNTDMPKILLSNHAILLSSLKKNLIPRYEVLRGVLRDDLEIVKALRNSPRCFTCNGIINELILNIEVLRQCEVPQSSISHLITNYAAATYVNHSKFVESVNLVKEMGLRPTKIAFVIAIQVLLSLSQAVWESRFEFYERWGWNHEMVLQAFGKFPNFMKLSEEIVARKMSFFVKDMGFQSIDIAKCPLILSYSLEKRVIPRYSVIQILKSKGLVQNNLRPITYICITEEDFLRKFVVNFQTDLPLLPDVYKGLLDHQNRNVI